MLIITNADFAYTINTNFFIVILMPSKFASKINILAGMHFKLIIRNADFAYN